MIDGVAEATRERNDAPITLPTHWYNVLADLPVEVPPDIAPSVHGGDDGMRTNVPVELVRQSTTLRREIPIPAEVRDAYARWRPTPLRRAWALERHLGTSARIYYKYEGGNISGSHKLNSAVPQAYYYARAGARKVTTGTGAGQWGTALAAAASMFGLDCSVYMVAVSYEQKPHRRVVMNLLGAEVASSPSPQTRVGREFLELGQLRGNLALAIAEALEETEGDPQTRFCIGSGETYAILHQSVIGIEAREQLAALGEYPDVIIGCVGAGSNLGGIVLPFLRDRFSGASHVRGLAVEPASCPKMTQGIYAYDYTDYSGTTALQKMYTLGHRFSPSDLHAGGLRYHATSKVLSALYDAGWLEAVAYPQAAVFASAGLFARLEGVVPAPEAAHAIHATIEEAGRARETGTSPTLLMCVSGHGHFDMTAYEEYLAGRLVDPPLQQSTLEAGRASLPRIP